MHPVWNLPVPGNADQTDIVFFDDFITTAVAGADLSIWQSTIPSGGAIAGSDTILGGAVTLTGATTATDAVALHTNGAAFQVQEGKKISFWCRLRSSDADVADWYVGMVTANTTDITTSAPANGLYFGCVGDANLDYTVRGASAGSAVDTGKDVTDATFLKVGFDLFGTSKAIFWVDLEDGTGPQKVGVVTSGLPVTGTVLQPHISMEGGTGVSISVDYFLFYAQR